MAHISCPSSPIPPPDTTHNTTRYVKALSSYDLDFASSLPHARTKNDSYQSSYYSAAFPILQDAEDETGLEEEDKEENGSKAEEEDDTDDEED